MLDPARCLTLTVYGTLLGMVTLTAMAPVAVSTYRPMTPTIPAEDATAKRRQRVRPLCGCSPVARTTSSASGSDARRARRPVLIDRTSPAEVMHRRGRAHLALSLVGCQPRLENLPELSRSRGQPQVPEATTDGVPSAASSMPAGRPGALR